MTLYEGLSLVVAVVAALLSAFAVWKSNSTSAGMIELSINERITSTKEKAMDVSLMMAPLLSKSDKAADDKKLIETYETILGSAIENNLNAYEEACAKYLDRKVDTKRFRKAYYAEIRQLVENQELKKYLDPVTSKYKAILKVYNEWENLEK